MRDRGTVAPHERNVILQSVVDSDQTVRVLLVEDEFLVALDAEDMLRAIGFNDVSMESTLSRALRRIESDAPDLVFLDMNLNGERSDPIALYLAERGVPFVITSGYYFGPSDLEAYGSPPYLRKPYTQTDLSVAARAALSLLESTEAGRPNGDGDRRHS